MKLAASISNVNNPERVDIGESSNEKRNSMESCGVVSWLSYFG